MSENVKNDNRDRIRELFAEAYRKKSIKERSQYLDEVCGSDSKLREELDSLLQAYDKHNKDFLESPPFIDQPLINDLPEEKIGSVIGRYKLLEKIGEGGMAVVYMAQQERPVQRKVALKIIKLGMDTKQVIARFEAERQALALMDHPNIAKVLDAGSTEMGRPYFVMDLVKGIPITKYCDENNLSTMERLKLFIQVCGAIQHAHQKGVIHRDIKPTNVLVQVQEGQPLPKVIDFGIAKAISKKLTEKTLFTRFEQLVGTPDYMSPEQAEWGSADIDTRTDIYSLGVLLYELLTGATPFDAQKLREAGYSRMLEIIRGKEPTKPSTMLDTIGETLPDIAAHRKSSPEGLKKLLNGDLDWIVMKAMDKDRARRYETAAEFGIDINRHLDNEPVVAAAPSTRYRLRKFVRRNRVVVVAGLLIFMALALGAVFATVGMLEARKQRNRAVENFDKVRQLAFEMFEVSNLGDNTAMSDDQTRHRLRQVLLEKTLNLYEEFLRDNENDPKLRQDTLQLCDLLGRMLVVLEKDYEQAVELFSKACKGLEELLQEYPDNEDYRRDLAFKKTSLAFGYEYLNNPDKAQALRQESLDIWEPLNKGFYFGPMTLGPGFSSKFLDLAPTMTEDELLFLFHTKQIGGEGKYDIWMMTRNSKEETFGEPVNLGSTINTKANEGTPHISADGLILHFCSDRNGGYGKSDIYVSNRKSREEDFGIPVNLDSINSSYLDEHESLSEDGLCMVFKSTRPGVFEGDDLWISERSGPKEQWGTPKNLGRKINSPSVEQCPFLSPDGLVLVFSSGRPGGTGLTVDLFITRRKKRHDDNWSEPENLGPGVNNVFAQTWPWISYDMSTLTFVSTQPGGTSSWDIWQIPILGMPEEYKWK